MRNLLIALALALFLIPLTVLGQPKYDTKPFDLSSEKLPAGYNGCDITIFHQKYLKQAASLSKSEFETMEQYKERLDKSRELSVYAFSLPPKKNEVAYDPEFAGTFKIRIIPVTLASEYDDKSAYKEHGGVTLKSFKKPGGSYIGENQFGVKNEIQITYYTQYVITFSKEEIKAISFDPSGNSISLIFNCPPEKAKKIKPSLNTLFLCRPLFSGVRKTQSTATLTAPWENRFTVNFLRTELAEVWVYDITSGEILLKRKTKNKEEN